MEIDEALKYDVIALPNDNGANRYTFKNTQDSEEESMSAMALPEPTVENDTPPCILCEFLLTKIEIELRNETEQDKIRNAVENICHKMPKTVTNSCNKFMERYANRIIDLLTMMPPQEICKKMQLCSNNELDARENSDLEERRLRINRSYLLPQITEDVIECGVCHGVTTSLLPYFRRYHNKQSNLISKEVDRETTNEMISVACDHLPSKYYEMVSNTKFLKYSLVCICSL